MTSPALFFLSALILGLQFLLPAHLSAEGQANMTPPETLTFEARVTRVTLEGGFWALVADDARRYEPVNLSEPFRVEGLRVSVKARPLRGAVSFRMWGTIIEIIEIMPLEAPSPGSARPGQH